METQELVTLAAYGAPILIIWMLYIRSKKKMDAHSIVSLDESIDKGMTQPASIHPIISVNRCKGCGSCVTACPERKKGVIGIIDGKAILINPTNCIGHGACARACPFDAITLVFGTEERGIDIPEVAPNFETNVPNIYIAGELGGMGLIRNAITQGLQAMENIHKKKQPKTEAVLDVLIVGAGPAGFAASLYCLEKKLDFATIEQDSLGGTVFSFPRGKLVMTAHVTLPLVGKVKFIETSKEILLEFWHKVEKDTGIKINYHERVEKVEKADVGYNVTTTQGNYKTHAVLLAIGRRGTPRTLNVPGENQSKVVYRLIDPAQYIGQHVLIVGGGDSALEAATSIADEEGTTVTLSYRSEAFSRAKEKNREKVKQAENEGKLTVLFKSNVKEITEKAVSIDHEGNLIEIPNDGIIVSAGGILPTGFLKDIGIDVNTKRGTA